MVPFTSLLASLAVILAAAFVTWLFSLVKRDVSVVDSLWPLLFVAAAVTYAATVPHPGPRTTIVVTLVSLWAVRLAGYLSWRNWGEPEDRRYQTMRRRHAPNFAVTSLYLVFGLQGLLAWVISVPLLAAIAGAPPLGAIDAIGVALWCFGWGFEAVSDWQLARFKAQPASRGQVMDRGLWRYTRHPNYFGECCVWWGLYLLGLAAGGWWTVVAPLLMTFLLLRVSGVALLEQDIGERRPAYRDYVARTNAFFPGRPGRPVVATDRR
ncbi:MAG: putative rane protein [Deltaproteobacteria bacterium]|jgi:steroid 5-alpha reductase family enzyme|nr:putative rane protein [Deltaproteobacteria bacterium]